MTWATINLLEEIRLRIQKAIDDGNLTCKQVFIGDWEQIRKTNDNPICVIAPTRTAINSNCIPHGIRDDNTVRIVYIISKLAEKTNKLYNNGDTTGMLHEIPNIFNSIEKKRSDGTVDLALNGTSESLPDPVINYDYSQSDIVRVIITYDLKTANYFRGER